MLNLGTYNLKKIGDQYKYEVSNKLTNQRHEYVNIIFFDYIFK